MPGKRSKPYLISIAKTQRTLQPCKQGLAFWRQVPDRYLGPCWTPRKQHNAAKTFLTLAPLPAHAAAHSADCLPAPSACLLLHLLQQIKHVPGQVAKNALPYSISAAHCCNYWQKGPLLPPLPPTVLSVQLLLWLCSTQTHNAHRPMHSCSCNTALFCCSIRCQGDFPIHNSISDNT